MTAREAAAYLRVSLRQLRELELNAGLPVRRMGTGPKAPRRFIREELREWLESRCIAPRPGQPTDDGIAS